MSFPRYPRYKASGVEWLGDVPEGWEVVRLRQIGPLLKGGGGSKEDITETGVPCVRYGDLYMTHSYHINATRTRISEARAIDYTPIRFGDVLFAASGEKLAEIGKSAVNLMTAPAVCGGDVVILRPASDVDARFLGYSADSPLAAMQKASMGRGTTIKHIYPDELRQLMLTVPPLPEQLAIAAFLDRETAKIDELVEAQARLIELLKEKRQAVISHAVTKGLNPHAPMKPSGVEWLGDVPEHWEVKKMRFICDVQTGGRDTEHAVVDGEFPFFVRSQVIERINTKSFDGEAVLTAGDGAGVGKVFHHFVGAFDFHQRVYMLSNFRGILGRFVFHYLRENFYKVALQGGAKSTVDSLRRPVFLNFSVCVPPIVEQDAIVASLESQGDRFDSLMAEAERAITLLRERRSALISAAVTGQIDVRNAVTLEVA